MANRRAGKGEPQGETAVAGEQGDYRGVHGAVEGVRRALPCEQGAEGNDQDRAAGEHRGQPGPG